MFSCTEKEVSNIFFVNRLLVESTSRAMSISDIFKKLYNEDCIYYETVSNLKNHKIGMGEIIQKHKDIDANLAATIAHTLTQINHLKISGDNIISSLLNCIYVFLRDLKNSGDHFISLVQRHNDIIDVFMNRQASYDGMRLIGSIMSIIKCEFISKMVLISGFVRYNQNTKHLTKPFLVPADDYGSPLDIFTMFPPAGSQIFVQNLANIVSIHLDLIRHMFSGIIKYMDFYKELAVVHNSGPYVTDATVKDTYENVPIYLNLLLINRCGKNIRQQYYNLYPEIKNLSEKAKAGLVVSEMRVVRQIDLFRT